MYSVGYAGSFWLLLLYFFFVSFKKGAIDEIVRKAPIKIAFLFVVQAVAVVFLCAIPWAFDTFPLSSVDSVLFTLFSPVEGAGEFVISSLKDQVVITGCQTFLLLIAAQIFGSVILFRKRIGGSFRLGPLYSAISSASSVGTKFVQIQKIVCKVLVGCVVVDLLLVPSILLSPELEALLGESIDSEFYKNRYVDPAGITAPEKGTSKNLVVVFVESMTNNYKAYTPELNEWQSKGLGFFPGSESVSGTGWTIAGITAALCGLPLNMPMGIGEYHGSLPTYLPNAVCLMDILHEQGYNQMFVQGTSAEFTQKRKFWTTHGLVEVHDELHYKKQGKVPEDYHVFLGNRG